MPLRKTVTITNQAVVTCWYYINIRSSTYFTRIRIVVALCNRALQYNSTKKALYPFVFTGYE